MFIWSFSPTAFYSIMFYVSCCIIIIVVVGLDCFFVRAAGFLGFLLFLSRVISFGFIEVNFLRCNNHGLSIIHTIITITVIFMLSK